MFFSVFAVALLAEGVDRNNLKERGIEMAKVALLAEGVDRNLEDEAAKAVQEAVALLAEGVDRNYEGLSTVDDLIGRPPRGGRG